jgi:hypothetical protein
LFGSTVFLNGLITILVYFVLKYLYLLAKNKPTGVVH